MLAFKSIWSPSFSVQPTSLIITDSSDTPKTDKHDAKNNISINNFFISTANGNKYYKFILNSVNHGYNV